MPLTDLLTAQLTDPFRIGLIVALLWTALRTERETGRVLPLLAGLIFVAVIIPSTMPGNAAVPVGRAIATGLVANAVLLALAIAGWQAIRRLRG